MSRTERREYLVGILAAGFLAIAFSMTVLANRQSIEVEDGAFHLIAEFGRADGIYVGSPVRAAGVEVGVVSGMTLNEQQRAILTLQFGSPIALTEDAFAIIETDGLFGSKYIELDPGGDDVILESGDRIYNTQDSQLLEDIMVGIVERARAASESEAPNE